LYLTDFAADSDHLAVGMSTRDQSIHLPNCLPSFRRS
jgi:hypothetical protein